VHPTQSWGLDPSAQRPGERRRGRLLIADALAGHPPRSPAMSPSNYLESETPQMANEHAMRTACRNASRTDVIVVGSSAILGVVAEYDLPCYATRFLEVDIPSIARNEGEIGGLADVSKDALGPGG
jgi:hypothetical protein